MRPHLHVWHHGSGWLTLYMPFDIMKPKELLITRLQEHIVPFMEERGFRFSKSRVHFTRKVGQVCLG